MREFYISGSQESNSRNLAITYPSIYGQTQKLSRLNDKSNCRERVLEYRISWISKSSSKDLDPKSWMNPLLQLSLLRRRCRLFPPPLPPSPPPLPGNLTKNSRILAQYHPPSRGWLLPAPTAEGATPAPPTSPPASKEPRRWSRRRSYSSTDLQNSIQCNEKKRLRRGIHPRSQRESTRGIHAT